MQPAFRPILQHPLITMHPVSPPVAVDATGTPPVVNKHHILCGFGVSTPGTLSLARVALPCNRALHAHGHV